MQFTIEQLNAMEAKAREGLSAKNRAEDVVDGADLLVKSNWSNMVAGVVRGLSEVLNSNRSDAEKTASIVYSFYYVLDIGIKAGADAADVVAATAGDAELTTLLEKMFQLPDDRLPN